MIVNMKKISIIVPVYNTGKYIKKCLNSIVANQTMKNLEIIIVNDGSTDNSEEIIKKWIEEQETNTEIKYFKKENGGLSDARNYGVGKATGDYISFIDSDDYIENNIYKNLEKYMNEDIDLIKFKATSLDEAGKTIEKLDGPVFEKCTGEEAFEKLCTTDNYLEVAWLYLYRKEFFTKNKFQYENGIFHEDFGLTPFVIINAKSVVSTNYYGYYYVKRENSITTNNNIEKEIKKAYDVLKCYDNSIKKIDETNVTEKTKKLIKRYYTNSLLLKVDSLNGKEKEKFIKQIKSRKVYKNIKAENLKQLIKKILIMLDIKLYLKMR